MNVWREIALELQNPLRPNSEFVARWIFKVKSLSTGKGKNIH